MSQQTSNIHPAFQADSINSALLNINNMPDIGQVRLPVVKALLSVSGSTVWRLVKKGKLKTYKLTERTTTFNVGELRAFISKAGV